MRYAYLKQNNAVQELKRVSRDCSRLPEGGPDAYVAHFLHVVGSNPALLLSIRSESPDGEFFSFKNIKAKTYNWFPKRQLEKNVTVRRSPIITLWLRFSVSIKIFLNLFRFNPDVVLCWAIFLPLWASYLSAFLRKSKFIYCRHTSFDIYDQSLFKRFIKFIDIWIIKRASKVIVHGPYLKKQALDVGVMADRLIEFNWSFSDLPEIYEVKKNRNISKNQKKIVLFIGRLELYKGIFDLLDACEQRLKSDDNVMLKYAGVGAGFDLLLKQIEKRGLSDKVVLLGMVPHENLAEQILESYLVITPTQSIFPEGRCMATMEGLVMGVPVIAPDFGPFPFLVKHGENGLLYEPDSVCDLSIKIHSLLDNISLYESLCEGARRSSKALRTQGPNFSEAVKLAFN